MFTKFWRYFCTNNNIFVQTNWINYSSLFSALLKVFSSYRTCLLGFLNNREFLLILTNTRLEYCHYIHRIEYVQLDISTASHSFVQTSTIVIYRYHLLVPQILIALHWQYCWVRGRGYVQVSFYPIGCRGQPCPWHVGERATMIENYFHISFFEIFVNRQSTHVEQWFLLIKYWNVQEFWRDCGARTGFTSKVFQSKSWKLLNWGKEDNLIITKDGKFCIPLQKPIALRKVALASHHATNFARPQTSPIKELNGFVCWEFDWNSVRKMRPTGNFESDVHNHENGGISPLWQSQTYLTGPLLFCKSGRTDTLAHSKN